MEYIKPKYMKFWREPAPGRKLYGGRFKITFSDGYEGPWYVIDPEYKEEIQDIEI